jgi:pyruvate,water dikinase
MEGLWIRLVELLPRRSKRTLRVPVAERFRLFRAIGNANDSFLRQLARVQERMAQSSVSGMDMVASVARDLSVHIGSMVRSLVAMTGGNCADLVQRHETLDREIKQEVSEVCPNESGPHIVWLSDAPSLHPQIVGPKAARLAEVALGTGLRVPPFFTVSVYGYRRFMEATGIRDMVNEMLWSVDLHDFRAIRKFADFILKTFSETPFPPDLEEEMLAACRRLVSSNPDLTGVAVRSSAVVEDAESSFAGQFESILNVREEDLTTAYKQVVASKYRYEALNYSLARGFFGEDIAMPVLVMAMVQPSASGVAYSRSPDRPESAIVTAVPGLAQALIEGKVIPDTYVVSAQGPLRIESHSPGNCVHSLRCAATGGLMTHQEQNSPFQAPALAGEAACRVARAALALEQYFRSPQDVEWVLNESASLLVVQTRPLRVSTLASASRGPSLIEGYRILLKGAARASGGTASGPVFRLLEPSAMETVPEGVILCVPTTSPRLAGVMGTVRGIVAAAGSPTGHMATVAREFGVPCLVGAEGALAALTEGVIVTMDADAGVIYEGEVGEILRHDTQDGAPPARAIPIRNDCERLLQRVAPLTLCEPGSPLFCPQECKTLHDIARYVHQKSMEVMFELDELSRQERRSARLLLWRVPMEVLLLDLGGGLGTGADRSVSIDKVLSKPLRALIEGMTDPRLRWAGPVGFDLKGFVSVVVRSAADDQRYGEPNYCLCSEDYVHFASRLAYHFATVDAICGHSINENYARFLFFGGAAVAARREWRAHFLTTVLQCNGFVVKQVSDRVEAMLAKRDANQIEEALVMLGRLMVASRHLDMVIESQGTAHALAQAFLSGDFAFERVSTSGH